MGGGGGYTLCEGGYTINLSYGLVRWRRLYSLWRRLYTFVEEVIHPVEEVVPLLLNESKVAKKEKFLMCPIQTSPYRAWL